jgi:hypothetical protein
MSINSVTASSNIDSLVQQIITATDTDKNGQVSAAEFGAFLTNLVSGLSKAGSTGLSDQLAAATSGSTSTAAVSGQYRNRMLGFDFSRMESAASSPKYAFANLAQNLEPTDANMQLIAQQLGASVGHLDSQNNFMLDADAGGYIGVRDRGFGAVWQWMAYNPEHPGPNGEIS